MLHKQQVMLSGCEWWMRSELIQTVTNCTPLDICDHQALETMFPVSLDAEDCLAIINGPAWCSRQFWSIRNRNALRLIRQTKPKYPLLVMRTLCHSLTPLPFWPCRKRAQGKHLHFFLPAETLSFDEVERMKGRMREQSIASYTGNGDCMKQWCMEKGFGDIWWESAECSLFSWRAWCFFPPAAIMHEYHKCIHVTTSQICHYIKNTSHAWCQALYCV